MILHSSLIAYVIDCSALVPVVPEDLELGNRIVVQSADNAVTLDFELTKENFEDFAEKKEVYGAITTIVFP